MFIKKIKFRGHPCFKEEWAGFDAFIPVTLIIGKNNSGKSHLLQLVRLLCQKATGELPYLVKANAQLDEETLRHYFSSGTSSGTQGRFHWGDHGSHLVDHVVDWEKLPINHPNLPEDFEGILSFQDEPYLPFRDDQFVTVRKKIIELAIKQSQAPIRGKIFRQILADRDIQPEPTSNTIKLEGDGRGATNIVRRFINSASPQFPRDIIRGQMLEALNQIFGNDGRFLEISIQHLDGNDSEKAQDLWEIYLNQEHKGLVALSQSGSSLKTVFLVLLNLLAIPHIEKKKLRDYVFAFEELENNLHPSLLRRLLEYLESFANKTGDDSIISQPTFFLTTHSNVALDFFSGRDHAQIVHVSHDGKSGSTQTINQSSKQLEVIRELGSRASDLLQANGIIWVEGPSDRVYLNRWIELYSDGEWEEGRHYQCMFYGGGLLANLGVGFDEDNVNDLIDLLKINPNAIVISDSDKAKPRAHLKERVKRIRDEFKKQNPKYSLHWILEAREIENYLTADLAREAHSKTLASAKDPEKHESFFPKTSEPKSYLESTMKRKTFDKTELALLTTPHMEKEIMANRFDLDCQMKKIIELIKTWNK